jgi:hypothetical protein
MKEVNKESVDKALIIGIHITESPAACQQLVQQYNICIVILPILP